MNEKTLGAIRAHAIAEYPRECCGLVIAEGKREEYIPCRNLAISRSEHFVLDPQDYIAAENRGEVLAVVHSHPDVPAGPSPSDRAACEASGLPWLIIATVRDEVGDVMAGEVAELAPEGWKAPLIGRPFAHGVLDCYTLVQDWYREELGIELPHFERRDKWWDDGVSDLYRENFAEAGCVPASGPLLRGDIILMQIRAKNDVPNHAGIYLGDGQMLHHMVGQLSRRVVYGGYYATVTCMVVRHRSLIAG